jgi:hypothetical protein
MRGRLTGRIPLAREPPERAPGALTDERLGIGDGLLQDGHVLHAADVA